MLSMDIEKYHQLIVTIQEDEWYQDCVSNEVLETNYHPYLGNECDTGSFGELTEQGFRASCRHFAVTWAPLVDPVMDKNWYTLRHISQRNTLTAHIMGIISRLQGEFMLTDDPMTLRRLPYQVIVDEFKRLFPGSYMDPSIVSRVVRSTPVIVNGKQTPTIELLPRASFLVGTRIARILETVHPLLSDRELGKELATRFNLHVSRRYVTYCRNAVGIPDARLRTRRHAHFFSWGLVVQNPFLLTRWTLFPRRRGCMVSA